MPWSVTLAGETFTDANVAGTAYADELTGLPAMLAAFAREAAFLKGLAATSSTLVLPSTGPILLVTHQSAASAGLSPGLLVRVTSVADPTRLMIATVVSHVGISLALDVVFASGTAAADWLIGPPAIGSSLSLDPAPALAADLDAAGRSIVGAAGIALSGPLTVGGRASFAAAGQSKIGYLGAVSGTVRVRADDPTTLACTIVGDTTFLVAGAVTPGYEHAHKLRATVGGAGGWAVTVLPESLLTRSNDFSDSNIDSGWLRGNLTATAGVATPAGTGWTLAATGTGQHNMLARRAVSAAPHDYVGAMLLKANGTARARLRVRLDTVGHGAHVDIDLGAGTVATPVPGASGTVLGSGIERLDDGWFLPWLAVDTVTAGYGIILELSLLNAGGQNSFTAAGEGLLFGGATLCAAATRSGFQHVGASRAATVAWQGVPITWPTLPAGQSVDLMLQSEPDRIVLQDYTPEEI